MRVFYPQGAGGEFTEWLFGADRVGEILKLAGPYGNFFERPASAPMICVAGGSGLAPIVAVLQAHLNGHRDTSAGHEPPPVRDCWLYFGARTDADLYYLDEINAIGREWPGEFHFVPVLSEQDAARSWDGAQGLVTEIMDEALKRHSPDPATHGYLCGPPPMVDAGVAALKANGVSADNLFFDKFLDASTQPGGRAGLK